MTIKSDDDIGKILIILCLAILCAGCRSAAPPVSFYTLSAMAPVDSRPQPHPVMQTILIKVGPVHFPVYLDRPQIVTRSGAHRLEMSEFNRWAGRLDSDFLAVLAENLSFILPEYRVMASPLALQDDPDYCIALDVYRFEGLGDGTVLLNAAWTIRGREQDAPPLHAARSTISLPASGQGYDALVSTYSQAVEALSREIAAALATFSGKAEKQGADSKNP